MGSSIDLGSIAAKANLPAPDSIVAGVINDKVLMSMYYTYLRRFGIIMMDIRDAVDNEEYYVRIKSLVRDLGYDFDDYYKEGTTGFYIWVPNGVRSSVPIYACFVLGSKGFQQRIINVIDIGDNANALVAKGCASIVNEGAHSAITFLRVGENSKLTSIMIHNWAPKINVGSKTIGLIGKGSIYKYYYVKTSPVKAIGLSTDITGLDESNIEIHEATYSHRNTRINSSIQIMLKGKGSKGYITTRGVVEENGYLNTTLRIRAEAPSTRGHIECNGLVLGRGYYKTNPSLETSVDETMLTHEASIGKISGEQLFYLQSRGLSEDEASKIIILGFLSSIFTDLPGNMRDYVLMAIKQITSYGKGF